MAIDPKQIEEWKREGPGCVSDPVATWQHVIAPLLAEREEMLRRIERITLREVQVHDPGDGVRFVSIHVQAHDADQRHRTAEWLKRADEALVVLRSLKRGIAAANLECYEGNTSTVSGHLQRLLDDPGLAALLPGVER